MIKRVLNFLPLISVLITGCQSPLEKTEAGKRDSLAVNKEVAKDTVAVNQSYSLSDSGFYYNTQVVEGLSVKNLMAKFPGALLNMEPRTNQFNEHQVDTVCTVITKGASFEFYRIPGSEYYIGASFTEDLIEFKLPIKIGMSKTEFIALFPALQGVPNLPDNIDIGSNDMNYLKFEFKNNILVQIHDIVYFD